MFEDLDEQQRSDLRRNWPAESHSPTDLGDGWKDAEVNAIRAEVVSGKPRVQVVFDVEGVRLVKDYWLTPKGVHVFRALLRTFSIEVDDPTQLREEMLVGKECRVLLSRAVLDNRKWLEIVSIKKPIR